MPNKSSSLSYRWMEEVWDNGREDAIDEMMDANAIVHGIEGINAPGPEGFKMFFKSFKQQFPEISIDVEDVISEADFETARCNVSAVDANGKKVNFTGMTFIQIRNGKIVEAWNNFDFLSMYQQLGFNITAPQETPV